MGFMRKLCACITPLHGTAMLLLMMALLASCSQELDAPIPAPLETGALSVSTSEVILDAPNKPADEAIKFTWATERNTLIKYKLIFTSGSKSDSVDVPLNTVTRVFSNAELNDFLLDNLDLEIGKVAEVDVRLYAEVTINDKTASSNEVTISVTPSPKGPAYKKLWIVGNATPNDWNIDDPNVMVNDPLSVFQFKYNEVLNAGEFKIPTATGNWSGDFYMPPGNNPPLSSTSVMLIRGGNPDNKWKIDNAGPYKILLNISSSPFIKIQPFTPYDNIYIVGDATTAGWDAGNAIAMTVDAVDPNKFTWTGDLTSTGGQFRFLTSTDGLNGESFVAPAPDASITATQLAFTENGTPANNFKVKTGEEGTYKITVDQLKETISIVKQ
jgi:hypothetical protein